MKQFVEIFREIKSDNSKLFKEEVLKRNKDNHEFKDILKFVYDPMITTGLAKRKIEKEISVEPTVEIRDIFQAMSYVRKYNTGSDLIVKNIQNFLSTLDEEEQELAKSILIKDLPVGISSTTINKAYGKNFIKKYSVMLADRFEHREKDVKGDFAITLKLDGLRATVFNEENGITIMARSGKLIEGLVELEKEFSLLPKGMVYDGELIAENEDNLDSKDLFRVTQSIVRTKGNKYGVNFVMFDALPIEEFNNGKSLLNYKERTEKMDEIFSINTAVENERIQRVPTYYIGNDKTKIPEFLTKVTSEGFEGLMVNTLDGIYETRRSKSLLKVKQFYTVDLQVKDIVEHSRGGRLGSVIVDYKGNNVQVGSGFNDKDREYFWKNKEELIGNIIEVQYFEESTNSVNDEISLRFPVFIRTRFDKDEVSYS